MYFKRIYWLLIFVINIVIISTWKLHWRPFSCEVEEMAWNLGHVMKNRSAFTERFVFSERSVFTVPPAPAHIEDVMYLSLYNIDWYYKRMNIIVHVYSRAIYMYIHALYTCIFTRYIHVYSRAIYMYKIVVLMDCFMSTVRNHGYIEGHITYNLPSCTNRSIPHETEDLPDEFTHCLA